MTKSDCRSRNAMAGLWVGLANLGSWTRLLKRLKRERGMSDNAQTTPMHSEFPRWYREVCVEEDRERLHRRWTGVVTLVSGMTGRDVETMLRIVFRSKKA